MTSVTNLNLNFPIWDRCLYQCGARNEFECFSLKTVRVCLPLTESNNRSYIEFGYCISEVPSARESYCILKLTIFI